MEALSPLLLRNVVRERAQGVDEQGRPYTRFPRRTTRAEDAVAASSTNGADEDGLEAFVPGSSLAGAFRSLHENLAGGCLRVFSGDFLPGYRDKPLDNDKREAMLDLRDGRWFLARVEKVDELGRPTHVRLCDETVWISAPLLAQTLGGVSRVVSGAELAVLQVPEADGLGRREVREPKMVAPGTGWAILVTDPTTRRYENKVDPPENVTYAAGRLESGSRTVTWGDGVWDRFQAAAVGSDDMRVARAQLAEQERPGRTRVSFRGRPVGLRDQVRPRLYDAQMVWLYGQPAGDDQVTVRAVALAQVWRHGGQHPASSRVPEHLTACQDPDDLCPSCRLFGSADTTSDASVVAQQRAYRGHVRFSDALPLDGSPRFSRFWLAPLGAPRPGAGQMYLDNTPEQLKDKARKPPINRRPLREWGSDFDTPEDGYPGPDGHRGPRPLRGRKHYWPAGDHTTRPFFRAVNEHGTDLFARLYRKNGDRAQGDASRASGEDNALVTQAEALLPPARLAFRVRFENLTELELGGLLAALEPALLFSALAAAPETADTPGPGSGGGGSKESSDSPATFGVLLGGGRPLGFGTCVPRVRRVTVESATSRYLREERPAVTKESAVKAFRTAYRPCMDQVWQVLGEVTRIGAVTDWRVWYPPADQLPRPSQALRPEVLMTSFQFWKDSEGFSGEKTVNELNVLPYPGPGDRERQSMQVSVDQNQQRIGRGRMKKDSRRTDERPRSGPTGKRAGQ